MPRPEFFQKLGLFVLKDFLDAAFCAQLRSEIRECAADKGLVVGKTELNESIRRVACARISKPTKLVVKSKLDELKPKVEDHFQLSLLGYDGPHFLMYGPGAFYKPHQDASPGAPPHILQRRVAIVVFLNGLAEDAAGEGYAGGALTFYGLMQGAEWEKCAFSLEAPPGLLIAFRPSILHEVKPVISGRRFTIVSWFTDGSHSEV